MWQIISARLRLSSARVLSKRRIVVIKRTASDFAIPVPHTNGPYLRPEDDPRPKLEETVYADYHARATHSVQYKQYRRQELIKAEEAISNEMRKRLMADPTCAGEIIAECIWNETATPEVLRHCLRVAYENMHRVSKRELSSILQAQRKAIAKPTAKPTLSYIWQNNDLWHQIATEEATITHLCFFAVHEGLEAILKQWIEVDVTVPTERTEEWRGRLLRGLVKAHLTRDSFHSADSALRCFFEVLGKQNETKDYYKRQQPSSQELKPPPIWYLSTYPAAVQLLQSLQSERYPQTDPALFENFLRFCEGYAGKFSEISRRWNTAHLLLFHPSTPQHQQAAQMYREALGHDFSSVDKFLATMQIPHRQFHTRCLIQAHRLAGKAGDTEGTAWLATALKQFPKPEYLTRNRGRNQKSLDRRFASNRE